MRIDPSKVEAIVNWPTPKSITEVRSFLGETQYWWKFIPNFSAIAAPMHAVTSVKRAFQWGHSSPFFAPSLLPLIEPLIV